MTALSGKLIGLSVSDAPDRARLGFPAREVDRALFSMCTVMVRSGAKIVYGGNLDVDGLTFGMFRHLSGSYAVNQEAPFIHVIPEPVFRKIPFDSLVSALREGASVVETRAHLGGDLFPVRAVYDGLRVGHGASSIRLRSTRELSVWLESKPNFDIANAFSSAREAMTRVCDARVVLGGKMGLLNDPNDTYCGSVPGIFEEALLSLANDQPCVPLGAFGGATRDLAIALGLLDPAKRVPRGEQSPTYEASLHKLSEYRDRIPNDLKADLSSIANDERGEPMAYNIADVLKRWLALDPRSSRNKGSQIKGGFRFQSQQPLYR